MIYPLLSIIYYLLATAIAQLLLPIAYCHVHLAQCHGPACLQDRRLDGSVEPAQQQGHGRRQGAVGNPRRVHAVGQLHQGYNQ